MPQLLTNLNTYKYKQSGGLWRVSTPSFQCLRRVRNVFALITTLYLCFVFGGVALVCSTNNVSFTLTASFPFVFGSLVVFRCSVKIRKQKKMFCFLFSCPFFFLSFFFLWACKADTFTSCCKEQRDRQPSLWPMKSKNKCVSVCEMNLQLHIYPVMNLI